MWAFLNSAAGLTATLMCQSRLSSRGPVAMVMWRCTKLLGGHYPKYEPLKRTSPHRKKKNRSVVKLSTACIHGTEPVSCNDDEDDDEEEPTLICISSTWWLMLMLKYGGWTAAGRTVGHRCPQSHDWSTWCRLTRARLGWGHQEQWWRRRWWCFRIDVCAAIGMTT